MATSSEGMDLDFTDPRCALERWLAELRVPPPGWLTRGEWLGLYRVIETGGCAGADMLPDAYRCTATLLGEGLISPLEFALFLDKQEQLWHQAASGASAHRAARLHRRITTTNLRWRTRSR